ncbi:mechanosensitive ion channel [Mycobacterium sp. PS03-16]|uniref:mechanosensitive ion channel family protein n=1 Tax=Mycobacterium sp. PS03-16 TaxID=2559611 RepID=UPI0010734B8A|nr:mechanosensitive ion channel domain-containing protein [Mycobacterium sp. PS03-16]TFV56043.1 mechanosensitive ion channel [Mycobacterium sp. PS03-16]
MPDENELESATDLAVTLSWVAGAVVAAYVLGVALTWILGRAARRSKILKDIEICTRTPIRATLVVIAVTIAVQRTSDLNAGWRGWVDHTLLIALIATLTWLVTGLVNVAERQAISRFGGGDAEMTDADRHRRRVRTQVTVLRRLAVAVVVLLGAAACMMTFPSFSDIGTTLFASAGVLSVVAGLAAQTSLGSVFAGLQIAFSDAIRVGDIVVLEDEWGRIEEITLTYVVVRLWDERRLVLPCTYFTTTPFQNWTRNATEIMGTVELDVDFSIPLDDMRAELDRLLAESELWDGRSGVLQVTDAVGGCVRVRMLVSAPNAGALFDLRCAVREGLVDWMRRTQGAMPVQRIEATEAAPARVNTTGGETRRVSATVFSGSPEAEARARAFDPETDTDPACDHHDRRNGNGERRDDFADLRGRGD